MSCAPGTILVLDDDRLNRMMLTRFLTQAGHTVITADHGRQGIELMHAQAFDVILLDVRMPEMDGFAVLEYIMGDSTLCNIPVVMVSGLDEIASVVTCIEMGAADYIHKPFDPGLLRARIENSLEKKRSRDKLQESYRQLQALEKLRDDLTHMIVHDLRTPLTSLLSGLFTMESFGALKVEQQECLDIAIRGGQRLLGMINDLLDIGKMESGAMTLTTVELTAAELLTHATEQVRALTRDKRLTLRSHTAAELPMIAGDRDKLQRALVNLLGNAIKFTPPDGIIELTACWLADQQTLLFRVSDTGVGIPQEAFRRIFEKFGQVETHRAGPKLSTGLGLTFCKMVVEAHGGRIWVESGLNQGSVFSFTIPCRSASGSLPVAARHYP